MKSITYLLMALIFMSCHKTDIINHYLIKKIDVKELIENGFYKYSYSDTIENEDNIKDTIRSIIKYDMYSNVQPAKSDDNESYPTQLWNFNHDDSKIKQTNSNYLKEKLNNRIITYLFRNDSLFYKDIIVFSIDKSQNKIADLTTKEKIIKYYNDIRIPIKPIYSNNKAIEKYPKEFLIDNHKTSIISDGEDFYEFFVNYINDDTYKHILEDWYSGKMSSTRYYL